jgi:hypothetical protein
VLRARYLEREFQPHEAEKTGMRKSLTIFVIVNIALLFSLLLQAKPALSRQSSTAPAPTPDTPAPTQAGATSYQPKFPGDPAHSESENAALAYMRVVMRSELLFNKHYHHYAASLADLVHTGTFTKRMVNPDRGDYHASFEGKDDSFVITMSPNNLDAQHRSFYGNEDGKIRADDQKPADDKSPVITKAFRQ